MAATTSSETNEQTVIQSLQERIKVLEAQVEWFQRQMYGRKSEKVKPEIIDNGQLSLFAEELEKLKAEQAAQDEVTTVKEHKRKKRKKLTEKIDMEKAEVVQDIFDLTDTEKQCQPGYKLVPMGIKKLREEVEYVPARLIVHEIIVKSYKRVNLTDPDETKIIQAKAPRAVITRSVATASIISKAVYDKYLLCVPMYRQLFEWKRIGLTLSESTAINWAIAAAERLRPVWNLMHRRLVAQPVLQGDETPTKVLNNNRATSYMWMARTPQSNPLKLVYYRYSATRAASAAAKLYAGFSGVLQCDGYAGYNALEQDGVTRVGCLAHVRRKFFDAAKLEKWNLETCTPLVLIQKIFALDEEQEALSSEERRISRQGEMAKLFTEFWNWCESAILLPKSKMAAAVQYAVSERQYIDAVLEHGELEVSNNASERAMKAYVMARKNFLFSKGESGAETNAILMSLLITARENGLDPQEYLQNVLQGIAQLPDFPTDEQLGPYLPWTETK